MECSADRTATAAQSATTALSETPYNGRTHDRRLIMTTPTKPRTGQRVSVAEFLELDLPEPDDKRKMELDDGVLYIMPRPRPRHQSTQRKALPYCTVLETHFRGIVIEILSTDRNRDLVRKRQVYAEVGIPEYWIFDELDQTARQLELRDGRYVERARLTIGDTLTTPLLPGLAIPLADVFRSGARGG